MKYTATFERIGRDRSPASVTITVQDGDAEALADALYLYVRSRLASTDVEVAAELADDGTGTGQIYAGSRPAGRFTIAPATTEARDTEPRVPLAAFGQDHWSTFAYLETVTVDHAGHIDHDKMRTHPRRHPGEMTRKSQVTRLAFADTDRHYPTRIKSSITPDPDGRYGTLDLNEHDDYDCMADLEAAGLIERTSMDTVDLTAVGRAVAAELRTHKANGGNWHQFQPSASLAVAVADARRPAVTDAS